MHENEDENIAMTIVVRILEAEFEIRQVGGPRPILSNDEPGQQK